MEKKRKKRGLTIVIIIIVIIGVFVGNGIYHKNNNFDYYQTSTVKDIADIFGDPNTVKDATIGFNVYDTAAITKLFFADKSGNQTVLQRTDNGWTVNNDFTANNDLVNQMIYTLNHIRIKPVPVKQSENIITRLASSNIKVEVYQNMPLINLFDIIKIGSSEKLSKVFYIGGVTQDNMGSYILREGSDNVYIAYLPALKGSISARFTANPTDWRSHLIFEDQINNIQSVKLEVGNDPDNGFVINENGRYQYSMTRLNGQTVEFDTLRVLNLMSSFNNVRFEAFLNDVDPARRDSIVNSQFEQRLTVTTKDGRSRSVTTYSMRANADMYDYSDDDLDKFDDMIKDPDHKYALLSDGNEFVLIQDFVFGKLLKPADYYSKYYKEEIPQVFYQELETVESR